MKIIDNEYLISDGWPWYLQVPCAMLVVLLMCVVFYLLAFTFADELKKYSDKKHKFKLLAIIASIIVALTALFSYSSYVIEQEERDFYAQLEGLGISNIQELNKAKMTILADNPEGDLTLFYIVDAEGYNWEIFPQNR